MGFDMMQMLRNRNIFGGGVPQQGPTYTPPTFGPTRPDITTAPQAAPQPSIPQRTEGPATANYRQFLEQGAPTRDQFQPSKIDRLGAVLTGVAAGAKGGNGFGAAQNQLDEPYNQAYGDYAAKAGLLEKGAGLEASTAQAQHRDAMDAATLGIKRDNTDSLIKSRLARADLYDFKAKHPNAVFKSVPGGNIMALDPQNPTTPIDTGVSSGLADAQMLQDFKIDQIQESGAQSRATEGVRQSGRETNIGLSGEQARQTEAERQAGREALKTGGTETESTTTVGPDGKSITTKKSSKPIPKGKTPTSDTAVEMKDKNGKTWKVKPEHVAAFKKANGIK